MQRKEKKKGKKGKKTGKKETKKKKRTTRNKEAENTEYHESIRYGMGKTIRCRLSQAFVCDRFGFFFFFFICPSLRLLLLFTHLTDRTRTKRGLKENICGRGLHRILVSDSVQPPCSYACLHVSSLHVPVSLVAYVTSMYCGKAQYFFLFSGYHVSCSPTPRKPLVHDRGLARDIAGNVII